MNSHYPDTTCAVIGLTETVSVCLFVCMANTEPPIHTELSL